MTTASVDEQLILLIKGSSASAIVTSLLCIIDISFGVTLFFLFNAYVELYRQMQ